MSVVASFGRFWWDFIVGDDWLAAAGVAIALVITAVLETWWILPLAVAFVLAASLYRATRRSVAGTHKAFLGRAATLRAWNASRNTKIGAIAITAVALVAAGGAFAAGKYHGSKAPARGGPPAGSSAAAQAPGRRATAVASAWARFRPWRRPRCGGDVSRRQRERPPDRSPVREDPRPDRERDGRQVLLRPDRGACRRREDPARRGRRRRDAQPGAGRPVHGDPEGAGHEHGERCPAGHGGFGRPGGFGGPVGGAPAGGGFPADTEHAHLAPRRACGRRRAPAGLFSLAHRHPKG